jgi:hypothetical protein
MQSLLFDNFYKEGLTRAVPPCIFSTIIVVHIYVYKIYKCTKPIVWENSMAGYKLTDELHR